MIHVVHFVIVALVVLAFIGVVKLIGWLIRR
jgi:hypothetical protein